MKLIMRTFGDEHGIGDCDFAVLDLSHEFVSLLEKRCAAFDSAKAATAGLASLSFYDAAPAFIPASAVSDELIDAMESDSYVLAPEGWVLDEEDVQRTGADEMEVSDGTIMWSAEPRHTDMRVETIPIHITVLREMVSGAVKEGV